MDKSYLEQDFKKTGDDFATWEFRYQTATNVYDKQESKKMRDALEQEFKYLGSKLFNQGGNKNG